MHYMRWQRHGDPLYEPPTSLESTVVGEAELAVALLRQSGGPGPALVARSPLYVRQ
jgi:hypothetical protein